VTWVLTEEGNDTATTGVLEVTPGVLVDAADLMRASFFSGELQKVRVPQPARTRRTSSLVVDHVPSHLMPTEPVRGPDRRFWICLLLAARWLPHRGFPLVFPSPSTVSAGGDPGLHIGEPDNPGAGSS